MPRGLTLKTVKTPKISGIKRGIKPCVECGGQLISARYARDYNVYGCKRCGSCYYWDHDNKRFIPLAIEYHDLF